MRPAKSLRLTGLPLISLSVKSGACVPLVNNSVAYCKSRSASPAVCAKTFPAAITNNEIANNTLFISKHYANLTKKSHFRSVLKAKCKLCATLWHPPSHSLLIIYGISHTIFLIYHIGSKNDILCTFPSSSSTSGRRRANTGMDIAFESAKNSPSNCSEGIPEAKKQRSHPLLFITC